MSDQYTHEPLLDMFIFETTQLLEQLEQTILSNERDNCYSLDAINEIFRIMHTIKGSSAMMLYNNISILTHTIEDLFFYIRENKPQNVDYKALSDLIFEGVDFVKVELEKIKDNNNADGNADTLIRDITVFLNQIKQKKVSSVEDEVIQTLDLDKQQYYISQKKQLLKLYENTYKASINFEEGCDMENMRAYTVIHNLKDITDQVYYIPDDIIDNDKSIEIIRKDGFILYLKADLSFQDMHEFLMKTAFLKELELVQLENDHELNQFFNKEQEPKKNDVLKIPNRFDDDTNTGNQSKEISSISTHQSIISVSVTKLDKLMDLVGEMVIAEAMVIQNPDIRGLTLDNFQKAARQLNKITSEIQDMVMSIRMVPLSATFHKMQRIVRDMSKKLEKEVHLEIIGEETEVDKNIIEHISDPIMHLVRNSIDHGLETTKERELIGKPKKGTVTLEAKNAGSDVLVIVKDDGKGLSKDKIIQKAQENKLLYKDPAEMSDKEIYNLILLPGFSTKENVTEFSGRGVGMDVVSKNIESVGGSLIVDSIIGKGTTITLKIPLTLAIIDGMNVKVGNSNYTIPTTTIKESFRPNDNDIITDPNGNEMIMVRGFCYPILRLHELYHINTNVTDFTMGIIIMVEQDDKTICIFVDELIGGQQVVVKALPNYIQRYKTIKGLAGCTLLGDGSISLILDVVGLINIQERV